jgi:hypothetical protein
MSTLSPSWEGCLEIWKPQPPGTSGPVKDCIELALPLPLYFSSTLKVIPIYVCLISYYAIRDIWSVPRVYWPWEPADVPCLSCVINCVNITNPCHEFGEACMLLSARPIPRKYTTSIRTLVWWRTLKSNAFVISFIPIQYKCTSTITDWHKGQN